MANIAQAWKDLQTLQAEADARQKEEDIRVHEEEIDKRCLAYLKLMVTGAPQEELDSVKNEVAQLVTSLKGLRGNASS